MRVYYSDNHKGICIKYHFKDLDEIHNNDAIFLPVVYPKDNELSDYYLFSKEKRDICGIRNFLIKNHDWSFEKEWRIIKISKRNEGIKFPVTISEIYFGKDIEDDKR